MADSVISDAVKALLRDCIESFEQLEILLLLHRMRGDAWTPESLAGELNLAPAAAADALDHLRRWNLTQVRAQGQRLLFRYHAATPSLESTIHALAETYEEHRVEVMKLMNKHAIERVRTSAMRAFADAFFVGGGGKKKDG